MTAVAERGRGAYRVDGSLDSRDSCKAASLTCPQEKADSMLTAELDLAAGKIVNCPYKIPREPICGRLFNVEVGDGSAEPRVLAFRSSKPYT